MDEHKANAVIEAKGQGLVQRRHALLVEHDLHARHERDDQTAQHRRAEDAEVLATGAGDVFLARLACALGHAQGQDFEVLAPVVAEIVLATLRPHQGLEQAHDTRCDVGNDATCAQLLEHRNQLFDTIQMLTQAFELEGEGQAGADLGGALAYALQDLIALRQHHRQVAVIGEQGLGCDPPVAVMLDVMEQFGVLGEKG